MALQSLQVKAPEMWRAFADVGLVLIVDRTKPQTAMLAKEAVPNLKEWAGDWREMDDGTFQVTINGAKWDFRLVDKSEMPSGALMVGKGDANDLRDFFGQLVDPREYFDSTGEAELSGVILRDGTTGVDVEQRLNVLISPKMKRLGMGKRECVPGLSVILDHPGTTLRFTQAQLTKGGPYDLLLPKDWIEYIGTDAGIETQRFLRPRKVPIGFVVAKQTTRKAGNCTCGP